MTHWTEIEQARAKAHAKHGEYSIEGITADDPRWLSILAEEGGETSEATLLAWNALLQARLGRVAHEQTYDATGDLRGELVDVLAVASAWLDALDVRPQPTPTAVLTSGIGYPVREAARREDERERRAAAEPPLIEDMAPGTRAAIERADLVLGGFVQHDWSSSVPVHAWYREELQKLRDAIRDPAPPEGGDRG